MAADVVKALIPEIGGIIDKVSDLLKSKTSTPLVGGGLSSDAAAKLLWPGNHGKVEFNILRKMWGASDLSVDIGVQWDWGGHAKDADSGEELGAFIANAEIYANINSQPWDLTSCTVTGSFTNPLNVGADETHPIAQIGCLWTFDWALWWPEGHMETTNYTCTIRGDSGDATITKM